MNAQIHRGLTSILTGIAALSGLLSATDTAALGMTPTTVAWLGVGFAVASIVVTGIRQAFETP